jgi:pheromone shutdown protein TraB
VIVDIVCLGKVGGAADYCRKIKKYRLNDPEGALIVKKLVSAQTCFTAIILAFTVVETLRSIFDIELTAVVEWALWISWFSGIILVGAALLRLLARWGSFQSSRKFKETYQKIMFREGHGYKQAYAS